jgi:hypothetical protein
MNTPRQTKSWNFQQFTVLRLACFGSLIIVTVNGFYVPSRHILERTTTIPSAPRVVPWTTTTTTTTTFKSQSNIICHLSSYNLPPSGGDNNNNNNNNNPQQGLLTGVFSLAALLLFLVSPLGGIFLAITNSIVILIFILIPAMAVIAFNIWQYTSTIEGTCPSCGAPVRVLKDRDQPSLCFSCGAILQSSIDGNAIEFANLGNSVLDMGLDADLDNTRMDDTTTTAGSILDMLFPTPTTGQVASDPNRSTRSRTSSSEAKASQYRRESTIIDVDVEEEE